MQVLEPQLESDLDRARAGDLVQGIEAAEMAAGTEVVVQHLRRLAELRAQVVDRAAEVRVIQDVEEIASELQRKSFGEAELAAQCDVPFAWRRILAWRCVRDRLAPWWATAHAVELTLETTGDPFD